MKTTADILIEMAETFRERNAVYGDNCVMVGKVMEDLFPNGITLRTAEEHERFHLLYMIIVKLTRFAVSEMTHVDSIHDTAVYAAMLEAFITGKEKKTT
jgi:hypothetical protein